MCQMRDERPVYPFEDDFPHTLQLDDEIKNYPLNGFIICPTLHTTLKNRNGATEWTD